MPAILNFNAKPYISWKGNTFKQITSSIKKNVIVNDNTIDNTTMGIRQLFKANPLKIYRREIVTPVDSNHCYARTSISIDEMNRPNGSIVNSSVGMTSGLVNTLDNILPNNVCEKPGPDKDLCILSPGENAKRRVRSSGNVKRQFDISKNNDTYYTSTNQYLVSRNRTFQQNQYNYIRQGNSTSKPGDNLSAENVYSPNGISHRPKYNIKADTSFEYKWIGDTTHIVEVPAGYYSVEDINQLLKNTMVANFHFYIASSSFSFNQPFNRTNNYVYNQNIIFLLNIGYNYTYNKVELQSASVNSTYFPASKFMRDSRATWDAPAADATAAPSFNILANDFRNAIGFTTGPYSNTITPDVQVQTTLSNMTPGLQPAYIKLYYKPNNPQFAQQGAVSSSSLTTRLKYDSITNATGKYRRDYGKLYGSSVANALAYGVPGNGYTFKDKIGYPNKKTPVFSKSTGEMTECSLKRIANEI